MAIVVIPALLRKLTNGQERVAVSGRNVGQIIDALENQFPGFKEHLLEHGELKPSVAVSIDGEMGTGGLLDRVKDSSEVFFIPAIGGG
jgi:molybdopterin synthase sulfur carrier subunit